MTWREDAVLATSRAELEHAWWAAGATGERTENDVAWFTALAARLSDPKQPSVDRAAMNVLIKQLGART